MEQRKITLFKNIIDTKDPLHLDPIKVFKRIKEGQSKSLIERIRNQANDKTQNVFKKRLPSICFSGTFSERKESGFLEHSGLICLDVDGVKKKDMPLIRKAIESSEYTYANFISPRGAGFKIIVKINPSRDTHKGQFLALEQYYNKLIDPYCLDKSGKDVTRVCYESYDPDIFLEEESEIFGEVLEEEKKPLSVNDNDAAYEGLTKWIQKKEQYYEGNRNTYLSKLIYALHRYGVDSNFVEYKIKSDYSDYDPKELEAVIRSTYQNTTDFGKETWNVREFTKKLNSGTLDIEQGKITKFWDINDKGRVKVDSQLYLKFIEANGFGIYRPKEDLQNWFFVRVKNMIVESVDVVDIKRVVLDYIRKYAGDPIFDEFQMKNRYFEKTFLNALKEIEVDEVRDKQDECYFFFDDYYVIINKKGHTKKPYTALDGRHVWRNQICSKPFTEHVEFKDHDFNRFVFNALTNNDSGKKDRYFAACSALGYAIHTYKKQRLTKLIYSCDESFGELDGNAAGGTGKNLLQNCLKYVRSVTQIDGKDFDKRDKFKFQTVQPDTQIVVLDDYEGDIKELFSKITGNFEIEKKGKDKVSIPFESAPKLLVSSNSSPKGYSNSYQRRLHMMEFSQYYNENLTPSMEFGDKDFFSDDWSERDWNALYCFLIYCVQLYLERGLISFKSEKFKIKLLTKNTRREFVDFIVDNKKIDMNMSNNGVHMYNEFVKHIDEESKKVGIREFYGFCKKMCEIYGWTFEKEGERDKCYIKFVNYNGFDNK